MKSLRSIEPKFLPELDKGFRPASLVDRDFREAVNAAGSVPLVIALERMDGAVSRFEMEVVPRNHALSDESLRYVERIFKFLLWQRGGYRAYVGGPTYVGEYLAKLYSDHGDRAFDGYFMGEVVYGRKFEVVPCSPEEVPEENYASISIGGHLDGFRIGFDLGASDVKVSALIDGEVVFSKEIVWEPTVQRDPEYHYQVIDGALEEAASHLPRVDAIGGSAAGIYIRNRTRVASLFRSVPESRYGEVRDIFLRLREKWGVPLAVVNDGEVAALAGSMSLGVTGILGIALGSSQAAGYVDANGNVTSWLNELAFAPVDYNPEAPVDEWSGDRGCGALYFSQQCVFRLAPLVGLTPVGDTKAAKLRAIQEHLEAGEEGAAKIWQTIGCYMGYAIAHYADFYPGLQHVLLMGRVTSGIGGKIIVDEALRVLHGEFPELAERIELHLPDEQSRRVGQAIAAASLPVLRRV